MQSETRVKGGGKEVEVTFYAHYESNDHCYFAACAKDEMISGRFKDYPLSRK